MSGIADTTNIIPLNYGIALTQASVLALSANPTRGAVTFHNPNAGKNIWIAPLGTTATPNGAGCYQIFPGGDRVFMDKQRATCGWNACTDAAQTANLSILEWPN